MWNIEKVNKIQPNFITATQPWGLVYLVRTVPMGLKMVPSIVKALMLFGKGVNEI